MVDALAAPAMVSTVATASLASRLNVLRVLTKISVESTNGMSAADAKLMLASATPSTIS